jgi:hypothetical protein
MKPRNSTFIEIDKDTLYDLYVVKKLTVTQIAKMMHCSHPTVIDRMNIHNIPRNKVGRKKGVKNDVYK